MRLVRADRPLITLRMIGTLIGVWGAGALATGPAAPLSQLPWPAHFANADDMSLSIRGRLVYSRQCASCHGRNLQGQPLWQMDDRDSRRRAPAHDQTGHTWMHSDDDLFAITAQGRFPVEPPDRVSHMPAFQDLLADNDILAVIAFIKARWPLGLRVVQAALNPGQAGLPRGATMADWRFPGECISAQGSATTAPR